MTLDECYDYYVHEAKADWTAYRQENGITITYCVEFFWNAPPKFTRENDIIPESQVPDNLDWFG